MSGWKPIETAPKEEKWVMLFGPDGIDIGRFIDWTIQPEWCRMETADYDNEGRTISSPTHWMQLPEPPK